MRPDPDSVNCYLVPLNLEDASFLTMREYGPDRVIGDVRFELSRESNSIHRYRVPFHAREKPTSNSTTTEGELNQPNPNVASLRWAITITGFVDRNHRNQRSQCPETPTKAIVLFLDDAQGKYDVGFCPAGLSLSQAVSLVEAAKAVFLREMGY